MGVIIIANHQRKLWNEKQHVCKSKIKDISKPSALYIYLKYIKINILFLLITALFHCWQGWQKNQIHEKLH